ncbi:MAG: DUF983 domain-containing protein [Bacteroidetes bacterium]|nr:DUF983 domain-containing protein [Bacteroidota bacterium]
MAKQNKPNYWWSLFSMKCPRCRRGPMYTNNNPWLLKKTFKMPDKCPECGQPYELEVGFWYGTAYVSYAVTVAFCVATFVAWWVLIGMSTTDNRFFWWMGINGVLLVLLQPWFMRLSRVIYLYFFVKYDENYKVTKVKTFDYNTEDFYKKEEPQK